MMSRAHAAGILALLFRCVALDRCLAPCTGHALLSLRRTALEVQQPVVLVRCGKLQNLICCRGTAAMQLLPANTLELATRAWPFRSYRSSGPRLTAHPPLSLVLTGRYHRPGQGQGASRQGKAWPQGCCAPCWQAQGRYGDRNVAPGQILRPLAFPVRLHALTGCRSL